MEAERAGPIDQSVREEDESSSEEEEEEEGMFSLPVKTAEVAQDGSVVVVRTSLTSSSDS